MFGLFVLLVIVRASLVPSNLRTAYFGAGCFWGVEHLFSTLEGVHSTTCGYMGGHLDKPLYPEVKKGKTGHIETVRVIYDVDLISYANLARFFFEIHDPTHVGHQGEDVGSQYQSYVFYTSKEQKLVSQYLISKLETAVLLPQKSELPRSEFEVEGSGEEPWKVATRVVSSEGHTFWEAEEYHQMYYQKTGGEPYCHSYIAKFPEDLDVESELGLKEDEL